MSLFKKNKKSKTGQKTAASETSGKGGSGKNNANKVTKKTAKKTAKNTAKNVDFKKQSALVKLFYLVFYFALVVGLIMLLGVWMYGVELNRKYQLSHALDGALWELPSRVYARPLELYVDKPLKMQDLVVELQYLDYTADSKVSDPGSYHINGEQALIYKNTFQFWDGKEQAALLRLTIKNDKISEIIDMSSLQDIALTRIEPLLIGSIYPKHGQDRILIEQSNTPSVLVDTLLAMEDRRFYSHGGVDPKGLARAVFQAIKDKRVTQGASTLTQQFIKNHYLTNERSISRKVKEAIMAVILEHNYSKQQILEGYLNEIFLGQDGDRAIHGFGLAAEFYFGKTLSELGVHQIASLVALVKEPSRANPYRHPDFAKRRRGLILDVMVAQHLISADDAKLAKALPLDVLPKAERQQKDRYYSFLQLAYKQLAEDYDRDKLAAGLNIYTTLDPIIQEQTERAVAEALPVLEKRRGLKNNFLQAASVIVNTATAEILAVVGDRDPKRHGFNRAVQAKRQPGSLLKPVVYLAALEYPQRYTLATSIDDSPLVYKSGGEVWKPQNYSKRNLGRVAFIDALVKSYNIPTARIALDIGIHDVVGRLQDLGARDKLPEYPSIVLGSVAMSPLEVAQIYESLANGGYRMPLRVINNITDAYDMPVDRYPMNSVKVISDEPYYLIIKAMQQIVKRGTAAKLKQKIPEKLNIAGKTGTTDNYRDSWFASFSGNYLNVVWVGNDDNKRTGLSGSNGAMRVWMDIMKDLPLIPLTVNKPPNVFDFPIDLATGTLMGESCQGQHRGATLPFINGSEPTESSSCYVEPLYEEEFIEFESFDSPENAIQPSSYGNSNTNSGWYNNPPQPSRRRAPQRFSPSNTIPYETNSDGRN